VFQGGIGVKKIFRKNQLVITALALMIAVAGYFSYMNNNMEDFTTERHAAFARFRNIRMIRDGQVFNQIFRIVFQHNTQRI
jgi:hypothetical protein